MEAVKNSAFNVKDTRAAVQTGCLQPWAQTASQRHPHCLTSKSSFLFIAEFAICNTILRTTSNFQADSRLQQWAALCDSVNTAYFLRIVQVNISLTGIFTNAICSRYFLSRYVIELQRNIRKCFTSNQYIIWSRKAHQNGNRYCQRCRMQRQFFIF